MARGGIYVIRLSDVHYYGGRTSDFGSRMRAHHRALLSGSHRNRYAQAVFDANHRFEAELLVPVQAEESRIVLEQSWIDAHWGQPGCVNLSRSAEGGMMSGRKHSEATKEKFRARRFSEETKKKWSDNRKGHLVSDETRAKLSAANAGKKRPDVAVRNADNSGWSHAPESIEKISKAGRRPCSEETRVKISASHKAKGIRPAGMNQPSPLVDTSSSK